MVPALTAFCLQREAVETYWQDWFNLSVGGCTTFEQQVPRWRDTTW